MPESVNIMSRQSRNRTTPAPTGPRPSFRPDPPAGASAASSTGAWAARSLGTTALAVALLLAPGGAQAQQDLPGPLADAGSDSVELVDRVAAVVADTAILMSAVQQDIVRQQAQGLQVPQDPAAIDSLARATLDRMIDETLLLQRAKREGVQVGDQEVDAAVQEQFSRIRSTFDSDQAFRDAVESAGMNMFQFRQMWRRQIRADLLRQRFQQQKLSGGDLPPATVSDEEVRRYFEQNQGSSQRPATLSFERITLAPEPTEAALDSAIAEAQRALEELREGTTFEVAARRYSDDPGTRERGGELGWVRRADMVPAFADFAWSAPPGRPVGPVQTRYGFHVIEVMNTRGGERQIRHLLVRPEIRDEDVEAARRLAESLRDSLTAGADADRLAGEHGLPGDQVEFLDLRLDQLEERFGETVSQAVGTPEEEEVIGPIRREASYDLPNFVVLRVTDYRSAGSYELEDVRDQIRQGLLEQKRLDAYLEQLRETMYVRVLF